MTALVALGAAGAAGAGAATRYVTPDGAGTACTLGAPCGIETGVEQAADGDEVVIGAGQYAAATGDGERIEFPMPGSITVRGAVVGPGRPVITTREIFVQGADSLLRDVDLRGTAASDILLNLFGGRAERILATAPSGQTCVVGAAGLITDSVCSNTASHGLVLHDGASARGVTAIAAGTAIDLNLPAAGPVVNSIARGGMDVFCALPDPPLLTNDHFATSNCAQDSTTGRVQSGLAFRVDPTDLRQAPGSTTIDAGTPDGIEPGELDLNGNLRIVGARPDIGAYEHVPPPGAVVPGAVEASATAATISPVIATNGGRTTVTLRHGPAPDQLTDEVTVTLPAAPAPALVDFPISGLAPFTTYHYAVQASSDGGEVASAPASFTTAALPASASLTAPADVTQTSATLHGVVDTGGAPGQVRFELTPTAGGAPVATPDQQLAPALGPRQVSAQATGLTPGTAYSVEAVLTTPAGTVRSDAGSLTTLPSPPTPPPPAPPVDRVKPRVTVRLPAAVRIRRQARLTARITCNEPCRLTVRARAGVRGGKPVRFRLLARARITLRLKPVRRTRLVDIDDVRLTLTGARRAALTALRAGRRVVIRIDIEARDAAGNRRRLTRFVNVRP